MKNRIYWMVTLLLVGMSARASEVYNDNVVIVLDASGSMSQTMAGSGMTRMAAAKQSIKQVDKTLPATTRVGLLVFGNVPDEWVYPLGPRDDAALYLAVDRIGPGGATPLGAYMKKGADRLLKVRKEQYGYGSYRLLVVTDGEASDKQLVKAVTPEIISRGITVDAIGVDMAKDHDLATRVHSYRRADDPAALTKAVQEVFAELGRSGQAAGVGDEAFDELDGLPPELAEAMIKGLMTSGDQPIGERAVVHDGTPVSPASPASSKSSQGRRRSPFAVIIVAVVVVAVLRIARSRSRR